MTPPPEDLFKGAAKYYARYRRPYPKKLFSDIVEYFRLDGTGSLLDLGCGTGEIVVPLASYFSKAIGLDPNAEMLEEAMIRAGQVGARNISWKQERAEDINESLGRFRLITIGAAFHWMEQEEILRKSHALIESGGGLAVIGDTSPVRGKEKKEPWRVKRQELLIKYLGPERRAGNVTFKDYVPLKRSFEEVLPQSPFPLYEHRQYPYTTHRNIDEIIGFLYSTSYAAKRLFGDQVEMFEHELRTELLALVPTGVFEEDGAADLFLLRK